VSKGAVTMGAVTRCCALRSDPDGSLLMALVLAAALVKVWLDRWQLDRARQTFPG
jgi:cytochrome oxidase assembly protein ShyY1